MKTHSFWLARVALAMASLTMPLIAAEKPAEGTIDAFLGEAKFEMQQLFTGARFPNVVVATDGTVLATHGATGGGGDWWKKGVQVRRSKDGGKTWSKPITIANPGWQGGGLTVDETTGDILAFVEARHPKPVDKELPIPLTVYRSADHGKTWKAQKTVIHPDKNGNVPGMHMAGHGITLQHGKHKGRLLRPARYWAGGTSNRPKHHNTAIYSDDGGKTWKTSDPFPATGTGEGTVAELSDGRIYYSSRRHWEPKGAESRMRWEAWSDDDGQTWKDLAISKVLPDGCNAGLVRLPVRGRDILLYSHPDNTKRINGTVWASFDGGKTWPIKRLLGPGKFAYSSLAAGRQKTPSEGWIYLQFEGNPNDDRKKYRSRLERENGIARFNLSWLLEGKKTGDGEVPKWLGAAAKKTAVPAPAAGENDATASARKILDATGVRGGIVVHLGCGDGKLTGALRTGDRYTVHGLERDPAKVVEARSHIRSLGVYGPVSVEQHSGSVLPYTDNLINLIVVQDEGKVPMKEVMRVLAPEGTAYVQRDGEWTKTVKPWPENIDQWGHYLHDASNNAVARDSVVGPPRRLQWMAPPLWLRSHETSSGIQSSVSAGGRLFYIFDEGLVGITDERLPDRWSLVCRDAFNGKLLWKRPLEAWGWRQWSRSRWAGKDWTKMSNGRTDSPVSNQRRIVADGGRLYATLAYRAGMSILDAATGDVITTVKATEGTSEILVSDGIAVCYTRRALQPAAGRRGAKDDPPAALVAVDGKTGKVFWRKPCGRIRPQIFAIDNGRIVFLAGKDLVALNLKDGRRLWKVQPKQAAPRTMVVVDDVVVMLGWRHVAAFDATSGAPLWQKSVPQIGIARPPGLFARDGISSRENADLFVIDGLVWRGMLCVNSNGKPTRKSPNALAIGWDLRTGEQKKKILVRNLRSPEHHHRCYRNKVTTRYLISSFEGAEFLDLQGDHHCQNNWVRGACRYGMMPANGMLYVPPDPCFCQPGSKLPGYAALKAEPGVPLKEVADEKRLEKGPAYAKVEARNSEVGKEDWPTFRHDAARHGATKDIVPPVLAVDWKVKLGGKLTAPVAADGKLFVAKADAHTVYALDMVSGKMLWKFTAAGRIDSPPTIYKGMVLFGSADGRVYCLRASDGELAWRFLAAPADRRVGHFGQVESAWPVHGSVLVDHNVAYFTAGRSTYLDGGIRVWGLEPVTGRILHKGLLEGPHRSVDGKRDVAFYLPGANSDVLVSEGGFIYMRQKKLTPQLKEVEVRVLSNRGARDVGLHVFSTAGLLDGSWFNRTFWMYSKRWPGFQLANQASKTGQLLVVDDEKTYAVRVFYRRNIHTPMFFPGKQGYLVFADANTNEPQIVGEKGSRKPLEWLPQSYVPGRGKLESKAFQVDKGIGYTRAEGPVWKQWLPVRVRAMVKAGDTLFVAGAPDVFDPKDPYAAFEARKGGRLVAVSAKDGKKQAQTQLEYPPVLDGLIAAGGRLFVSLRDGSVVCLAGK